MKIALLGSSSQEERQVKEIFRILNDHHVDIYIEKSFKNYLFSEFNIVTTVPVFENDEFDADFIFSIGGDGTFLKTVATTGYKNIPILGINTGHLGFLADISEDNLKDTLLELLAGKYRIEERTQLELSSQEDFFHDKNLALNEIAILKQDTASMITVHTSINNEYLASYQADGLIISTATGSTAYSLSVGGPIISPDSNNFIISAIAPHSLNARPLVIKDNSVLTLEVESRNPNFLISLDGRSEVMSSCSLLTIKKASTKIKLVKRIDQTFYGTLREKLMWGTDPRHKMK